MDRHSNKLPIEFSLLDYRPANFTIEDVNYILAALAWGSSPAVLIDPTMCRIAGRIGPLTLELLPDDPAVSRGNVPHDLIGWDIKGIIFSGTSGRNFLRFPGLRGGCCWTAAANRSGSGKPLIACSLYQYFSAPGFWYRARLAIGDFHLSGVFIPGVPVAFAGSNESVSWASFPAPADDMDLFLEKMNSDSPETYWRVDRWHKLEKTKETFRIKNASPVSRYIMYTATGPVVSEIDHGRALSLRWTGREGTGMASAFYNLNRASNEGDITKALEMLIAPCLNVVWAEVSGKSGIQFAGRVPVRAQGSDGILPMPAWTGVHDWCGFIPFGELPSETTQEAPFQIAADWRPGALDYPLFVSCYWKDIGKQQRIKELLDKNQAHSRESFQKIHNDTMSPIAKELIPSLLKSIKPLTKNRTEEEAAKILSSWNLQMDRDSAGAAVFGLIYQTIIEELFAKPLGKELYDHFVLSCNPIYERMVKKIVLQNQTRWLGEADSGKFVSDCFQKAMRTGRSMIGSDPSKWKWGDLHKVEFNHPIAVRSRFLEALYDVGPLEVSGSMDTIYFSGWSPSHPFNSFEGVTLTQTSDMTHPPQLFGTITMGISGHFFSSHYKDQISDWLAGRASKDPITRAEMDKTGFDRVLFRAIPASAVSMCR